MNLSSGTLKYLVADSLGSVRGVVSSSGSLTASTSYSAYGSPETTGGLTSYTPFGFAGGYTDATGLVCLINRYYAPAIGQFLSVDPLVDETDEPYAYAEDNPTEGTDPAGLCTPDPRTHRRFTCVQLSSAYGVCQTIYVYTAFLMSVNSGAPLSQSLSVLFNGVYHGNAPSLITSLQGQVQATILENTLSSDTTVCTQGDEFHQFECDVAHVNSGNSSIGGEPDYQAFQFFEQANGNGKGEDSLAWLVSQYPKGYFALGQLALNLLSNIYGKDFKGEYLSKVFGRSCTATTSTNVAIPI